MAVAHPEHQGVEFGLHPGRKCLTKNSLGVLGHALRRFDPQHVVLEPPHHVALEDARRVIVLRARLRFAAPDQRFHQLLFLSPAAGIFLVAQSIDADVFERVGKRAHQALTFGDRKIGVPDVVGLVKQQPEAQCRGFHIVDRQRRQPNGVAVGARLSTADPNLNPSLLARHLAQDMERALNRKLPHDSPLRKLVTITHTPRGLHCFRVAASTRRR